MPRRRSDPPIDLPSVVHAALRRVQTEGAVPRRQLLKAPPPVAAELDAALTRAGLEVSRSWVRVPLDRQLEALLHHDAWLPLAGLAARLRGASATEGKAAAMRFVAAGRATLALRADGEGLVEPTSAIVAPTDLATLKRTLEALLKNVRRASASPRNGAPAPALLREDVAAWLAPDSPAPPARRAPLLVDRGDAPAAATLVDTLAAAVLRLSTGAGGLAPVPSVVRSVGGAVPAVHDALLEGCRRGWFELQPESSMGRFSPADLELCPPGPRGTRLSWVRPLPGAPRGATP